MNAVTTAHDKALAVWSVADDGRLQERRRWSSAPGAPLFSLSLSSGVLFAGTLPTLGLNGAALRIAYADTVKPLAQAPPNETF